MDSAKTKKEIQARVEQKNRQRRLEAFNNPQTTVIVEKPQIQNKKKFNNVEIAKKERVVRPKLINKSLVLDNKPSRRAIIKPEPKVENPTLTYIPPPEPKVEPIVMIDYVYVPGEKIELPIPANIRIASIPLEAVPEGYIKTQRWNGEWVIVAENRLKKRVIRHAP